MSRRDADRLDDIAAAITSIHSQRVDDMITHRKRTSPPVAPKVTGDLEARVIRLACSAPPAGSERWSLRLLKKHVVLTERIPKLDHSNIGRVLKRGLHPHLKGWPIPRTPTGRLNPHSEYYSRRGLLGEGFMSAGASSAASRARTREINPTTTAVVADLAQEMFTGRRHGSQLLAGERSRISQELPVQCVTRGAKSVTFACQSASPASNPHYVSKVT